MGTDLMPFTIHKEAPKPKLRTMGQADKEIDMAKEVSYETHPELYHYPSGATEPVLKNAVSSPEGAETVSKEPASKGGPVGAKDEPKPVAKKK